ncbi:MAG: DAK2 domain-containing protein [Clostridia bacterium]|nr:DAK2 domain-containing protein [Clostridia bacterium]
MSKKVIDGEQFQKMVASAANSLDTEKTEINNLNVFPVPDGDTGINMSLTMKPAREIQVEPGTLAEAASRVANRLLRAARGNSGAILSLFFRGMSKSFEGLETADSEDIAKAIRSGTNEAYRAVSKPAEGTILTVMRGTAEIAEAESEQFKGNPEAFFERLLEGAEEVLEQTPEMLPVLKQANVVDAGGQGFVTMLKGMLASLKGHDVAAVEGSDDETNEGADFGEFDTDSITFAYCTECIVGKSDEFRGEGTAEAFKEYISPLGDSMVFVDDEEIIKVHIHTNDPGMVLSEAVKYGALEMVKIENMKKQHSALTSAGEKAAKGEIDAPVDYTPDKDVGFVAVCLGEGTAKIFRELGVHEIVTGGQTMNPSTDNLLDAIRKTRGREVFVLPNNKNIIMVANQAAAIIEAEVAEGLIPEQRVIVLETRSVPEGMSAMLAFDPDSTADDNAAAMTETFGMVHTLSVTRAVKDAAIDGISIKAGEYMGLCDRKIGYTGTDYEIIILEMLRNFPDASFVTVLYGDEVTEENANIIFEKMKAEMPNAEFSLLFGGQPLYDFVISVE